RPLCEPRFAGFGREVRTGVRTISGFLMFFFAGFRSYLDNEDWPVPIGLALSTSILNPHVPSVADCVQGLLNAAKGTTCLFDECGLADLGTISGVKNVFGNEVGYSELE